MDIQQKLADHARIVDAAIARWIPRELDEAKLEALLGKPRYAYDVPTAEKAIHALLWDLLDRGGKRWRPALLSWTARAMGHTGDTGDYCVIPEVIHNGTLGVDDVEDDSKLRRGQPALHVKYGVDLAVNASNAMYFLPLIVLMRHPDLTHRTRARMYDITLQEMINLSYGQGFDIYWHKGLGGPVSEEQYLQMCAYKTGTLSRMAARLGAALAGASERRERVVGEFAESLGIAFQIQDDVLNLKPADGKWGKTVGEDITEGKRTIMVIHAFERLGQKDAQELASLLNAHPSDEGRIRRAVELLEKAGSLDYARKTARRMMEKAWKRVDGVLDEGEAKENLKGLAEYVISRKI